jgi:hypothetical protein
LAADVDDGDAAGDSDPEALDSSDDEDEDMKALNLVDEQSEGKLATHPT